MVSTWSSGSTLPPLLNYEVKCNSPVTDACFSFVDFLPECRDSGGIFMNPQYANFRTLIDRANDWLSANPRFKVTTCESVEFKTSNDHINYEKMIYMEHGKYSTTYVRGLRLWVEEKQADFDRPQQIGYLNLIPDEVSGTGGIFSSPDHETLAEVIARFNRMIHTRIIPGRIITIETQEMKLKMSSQADPDRSYWREHGSTQKRFLFVLRIFYELSEGVPEEIGIMDFLPNPVSSGGVFSHPKYEPFGHLVEEASYWSAQQQHIRICNVQSVELKFKSGYHINPQKMDYVEHGSRSTCYVRILRVAYTKIRESLNSSLYPGLNISRLTCRTFVPVQLSYGFFVPEFEGLRATKERVAAWVRATGANVISAETAAMRMYTGGEAKYGSEATFTYNWQEADEYWIFVIRLYINGAPLEPPREMLPPVPEIQDQGCCMIS